MYFVATHKLNLFQDIVILQPKADHLHCHLHQQIAKAISSFHTNSDLQESMTEIVAHESFELIRCETVTRNW